MQTGSRKLLSKIKILRLENVSKLYRALCSLLLDPVYTVPDSRSHDIEFGQFEVIFTLTTFSMISCC